MRKIYFNRLVILLFLAVMLCSCKDDGLPLTGDPLTAVDNQMIPYEVGDEIYFVQNGKSEQVRFTVTKDTLKWSDRQEEFQIIRMYERTVRMQSDNGDYEFEFSLYRELDPSTRLLISFLWDHASSFASASLAYDGKGNFINNDSEGQRIYDSLSIENHIYHDVVTYPMHRRAELIGMTLYYNKTYGVLQIIENDEPVLTLIP